MIKNYLQVIDKRLEKLCKREYISEYFPSNSNDNIITAHDKFYIYIP